MRGDHLLQLLLLLLTYKEPGKAERLSREGCGGDVAAGVKKESLALAEQLRELAKPHVWIYLVIFSGFWFMFNALFDVLPAHLEDWVDTPPHRPNGPPRRGRVVEPVIVNFFIDTSKDGEGASSPRGCST